MENVIFQLDFNKNKVLFKSVAFKKNTITQLLDPKFMTITPYKYIMGKIIDVINICT